MKKLLLYLMLIAPVAILNAAAPEEEGDNQAITITLHNNQPFKASVSIAKPETPQEYIIDDVEVAPEASVSVELPEDDSYYITVTYDTGSIDYSLLSDSTVYNLPEMGISTQAYTDYMESGTEDSDDDQASEKEAAAFVAESAGSDSISSSDSDSDDATDTTSINLIEG